MTPNKENTVWKLVEELNNKQGITEIVINDPKRVFVERNGQFIQLNVELNKADIYDFGRDLAQYNKRSFDQQNPILDGNLPDGSRINIIAEPFAQGCPAITIRKYLKHINAFDTDPNIFKLNTKWVDLFKALVSARMNLIISGGTGCGKTTFMNLLLNELSPAERIVVIEDTIELSLKIPNVVRLEARASGPENEKVDARDLVKNTLRMRPDRIIIGEARGGELFDLLQAMNTGHEGSMSSIHANTPGECLSRMESLFLMSGHDVPYQVVRKQIAQGVDFIVQIGRNRTGQREVTSLMEVTGMEADNILSHTLLERDEGELVGTGITPKSMDKLHRMGGLSKNFFS